MSKFRFLGFLAAGIVALIGAALIIIWLTVDPNNFKGKIASAVKESTGRELKLPGDIKLSVFPWVALELGPASLGSPEGFGDEPFLSLTHASIRVKLLPLLHKRLEVAKLEVDGLEVSLRKNAQGKGNWRYADSPAASPAKGDAAHSLAAQLDSLANIHVKSGRVRYEGISVENLNFETGSLTADLHLPVSIAFDVRRAASGDEATFAAKFDLGEGSGNDIQILGLNSSGTLTPPGESRPSHWELTAPRLSLNLVQETLALPAFSVSYSSAHLTGSAQVKNLLGESTVTGTLALEPVMLREFAPRLGLALPATRDPRALSQLSATSSYSYDVKALALTHLQVRLDETTLQGDLRLPAGDSGAIQFDLSVDQIDLDRYRSPDTQSPERESRAAPAAKSGKPLDANGTLTVKGARVARMDITDLRVTFAAQDNVIHLYPLEAKVDGGSYSGNITWDAKGAVPIVSVDEHLTGIDMTRLLANTAGKGRVSGRATINVKASARGANLDAELKTLTGTFDANLANGALEGIDIAYELDLAQALLNKSVSTASSNSGHTRFDTFRASAQIVNGVAQTRDLTIASQALKVTGQGSVNLPTKAIDFKLLAGILTAPARNTEIPLKVSGSYASLSVKPDIEALAKDQLKQKLQDVLKKNGLQGLFSK